MLIHLVSLAFNLIYLTQYLKQPLLVAIKNLENSMSSLQEILDRAIARNGPDGVMIQQLRNQIMAEKRNQSTRQMYSSGITVNHSLKADTHFMASQPIGASKDD
jgi:hypothetical protein